MRTIPFAGAGPDVRKADGFLKTADNPAVKLVKLSSGNGLTAWFTNLGAKIIVASVPDKNGILTEVISGPANVQNFPNQSAYGAVIGRIASVVRKESPSGAQSFYVDEDNPENLLNDASISICQKVWKIISIKRRSVEFGYIIRRLRNGSYINISVKVLYTLSPDNSIKIVYQATSDRRVAVNLTNRVHFNLNGAGTGNILRHNIKIVASRYLPVDKDLRPSGLILPVKDTPFNFVKGCVIVSRMYDRNDQLRISGGYDHDFLLDRPRLDTVCAMAVGDVSGITLSVLTNQPLVHFYTGNRLSGGNPISGGNDDFCHSSFCMQPQTFAQIPDDWIFPQTILSPGRLFNRTTIMRFSA